MKVLTYNQYRIAEDLCEFIANPIINESDRVEIVKHIVGVDQVIFPCPLVISLDFIKSNNIVNRVFFTWHPIVINITNGNNTF